MTEGGNDISLSKANEYLRYFEELLNFDKQRISECLTSKSKNIDDIIELLRIHKQAEGFERSIQVGINDETGKFVKTVILNSYVHDLLFRKRSMSSFELLFCQALTIYISLSKSHIASG